MKKINLLPKNIQEIQQRNQTTAFVLDLIIIFIFFIGLASFVLHFVFKK